MSKQNSKYLLLPSVTFIISRIWFEHLHWLSEHLFPTSHMSSCTLGLCSPVYTSRCSLSPTVTLQGPKGPMEGYYYPLSKWTEGDHKTSLLRCPDGNPTPVELFERPGEWVQESRGLWSPPLRYLQLCQHHTRLPIWKDSSVTPVRRFQVLRLEETEEGWRRWPGLGFDVSTVARSVLQMKNAFNVSFWSVDYYSIILTSSYNWTLKAEIFIAVLVPNVIDFIAGNCFHPLFSFQQEQSSKTLVPGSAMSLRSMNDIQVKTFTFFVFIKKTL